jgi:hypothetical protein
MTAGEMAASTRTWSRVKWTRAGQLAAILEGSVDLDGMQDKQPAVVFRRLCQSDRVQAVRFVAQCLPRMDAAVWMTACLDGNGLSINPKRAEAHNAVRRWVGNPSDKLRRLAYDAGERAGWSNAEGAACLAVYLSGGSMAPAEQEVPVNPAPGAFGQAVAGSVLCAAIGSDAARFDTRLGEMLALADAAAAGETMKVGNAG